MPIAHDPARSIVDLNECLCGATSLDPAAHPGCYAAQPGMLVAPCRLTGEVSSPDGRLATTCGTVVNPAGSCCECGALLAEQGGHTPLQPGPCPAGGEHTFVHRDGEPGEPAGVRCDECGAQPTAADRRDAEEAAWEERTRRLNI